MKLYATTTSERASKGQGGNEYLEIEVKNERKEIILELMIENHNGLLGLSYFLDRTKIASLGTISKGKRQKGE